MDMDAALTLVSMISFFVLVATWIAAPLRAAEPSLAHEAAEPIAA
jgi:hypothetical protein